MQRYRYFCCVVLCKIDLNTQLNDRFALVTSKKKNNNNNNFVTLMWICSKIDSFVSLEFNCINGKSVFFCLYLHLQATHLLCVFFAFVSFFFSTFYNKWMWKLKLKYKHSQQIRNLRLWPFFHDTLFSLINVVCIFLCNTFLLPSYRMYNAWTCLCTCAPKNYDATIS